MGVVQTALSCDMGPDLDSRATEARFQPGAQRNLLCPRHTGLTAFPAVESKGIPTILQKGFMPAPNSIVVQIQKIRNLLAGFAVVEQQDRICPAGNAVVLALATHASLKLEAVC